MLLEWLIFLIFRANFEKGLSFPMKFLKFCDYFAKYSHFFLGFIIRLIEVLAELFQLCFIVLGFVHLTNLNLLIIN